MEEYPEFRKPRENVSVFKIHTLAHSLSLSVCLFLFEEGFQDFCSFQTGTYATKLYLQPLADRFSYVAFPDEYVKCQHTMWVCK